MKENWSKILIKLFMRNNCCQTVKILKRAVAEMTSQNGVLQETSGYDGKICVHFHGEISKITYNRNNVGGIPVGMDQTVDLLHKFS